MNEGWLLPEPAKWQELLTAELESDIGTGDLSQHALDPEKPVQWFIEAQAEGVLAGVAAAAFILGPCTRLADDGDTVSPGTHVLAGVTACGPLLSRERTALNVLMHLSGVATLTRQYVQAISGTNARIVDTRKTLPGLRALQKYAVRCGGGLNHRFGLYDGVMIKDNHILATGSITAAVEKVRQHVGHMVRICVEATTLEQTAEAAAARADVILLDNMAPDLMAQAVTQFGNQCVLEASGGINLQTVRAVAESGVDIISVGALTHSATSLSFHLELE